MIHVLLNDTNFDEHWAYPSLSTILNKNMHVLVIPLLTSDGWSTDEEEWEHQYHKGGKVYEKIVLPFQNYLIQEKQIIWFDPYKNTKQDLAKYLRSVDVIYLYGQDAEHMMICIEDLGLKHLLQNYTGIIMANHAGSNLLMRKFDSQYAWEEEELEGLGLLEGFALMPDYIEDEGHLARLIRNIEQKGRAVFAFGKDGGVLIQDGHYELLGNAFTATEADLDALYRAYEDAKSRQDYYGDNGLWG